MRGYFRMLKVGDRVIFRNSFLKAVGIIEKRLSGHRYFVIGCFYSWG